MGREKIKILTTRREKPKLSQRGEKNQNSYKERRTKILTTSREKVWLIKAI